MYILKQLFFSISVNSGFVNIYLAAFAARQIFSHYSPRFQRIVVKYILYAACAFFSFLHAIPKCSKSVTRVNLYRGLFCDARDACHSWLHDDVINFIIIY